MAQSNNGKADFEEELDRLKEYIEDRKASLEEEIEESLHLAIANAKDSLELIQENIEPKIEKFIHTKLEQIDHKMENWKNDARRIVREEIDAKSEELNQKLLDGLKTIIDEKRNALKEELFKTLDVEVKKEAAAGLKAATDEIKQVQMKAFAAIGLSILSLLGFLFLVLKGF